MFINLFCWLLKLLSQKIHEVLHQVSLSHEQVLTDVNTVTLKLVLLKHDLEQCLVCLYASIFDPLGQLVSIKPIDAIKRYIACLT